MKVAFIDYVFDRHSPIGTNGLSEVVWNLAEPLAVLGVETHVAGPYISNDYPSSEVHAHRFDLPLINYRNVVGHILIILRAIKTLQEYGPFDVFHAPDYLSTALLCLFGGGTPVVLTEPGNIYDRVANGNPYDLLTTQVLKWAARVSGRKCSRVIATSEEMAYWWQRCGATEERIARIPLGVDLTHFAPVPNARQRLGWRDDQRHILFVARLSNETGAAYLLQAAPAIIHAVPPTQIHIVGSGADEKEVRLLSEKLHLERQVVWHGWIPLNELASYYSAADVMVFPGTSGGTPRVMLQAMACGTPFVASAIGGIVDHIEHGRNGLLVPSRDIERLADTVLEVFSNPGAARVRADQAQADIQQLAWPIIASRVETEVYRSLVEPHQLMERAYGDELTTTSRRA